MTRGDRSIWRARSSGIPTPVSSSSLSAPHAYSGTDLLLVESASEIMGLPEARRARGLATYVLRKQGEPWLWHCRPKHGPGLPEIAPGAGPLRGSGGSARAGIRNPCGRSTFEECGSCPGVGRSTRTPSPQASTISVGDRGSLVSGGSVIR